MRDLYEVFNDFNMEEEKDLEVMNDLEKQKWKKKLRKEIRKPMKTGKKVAVSAGCLGIAAGLFVLLTDSEVLAVAKQAVEETYRSIAVWVGGTPEENDYVQEVYGKATANGREITIVDMIVDEDLLQISYRDRDLDIENFLQGGYVSSNPAEETKDSNKYFLDAELLVDGKPAGSGAVSMISLSCETNAIDGNFCIYTGDFGVDMSKVEEAELILRQRYEEAEEEWDFSLDLEKEGVDRIVHPGDRPSLEVLALLDLRAVVIRNDAPPLHLAAQTHALQLRVERSEVDHEQIVGRAVDRMNKGRLPLTAAVKERFVVARHEAVAVALEHLLRLGVALDDFNAPGSELRLEEGLGRLGRILFRFDADLPPGFGRAHPRARGAEGFEGLRPVFRRDRRHLGKGVGREFGLFFRAHRSGRRSGAGAQEESGGKCGEFGERCGRHAVWRGLFVGSTPRVYQRVGRMEAQARLRCGMMEPEGRGRADVRSVCSEHIWRKSHP